MTKYILVLSILSAIAGSAKAQSNDYKVVFDITSKDSGDQKNVIRWVNTILKENPGANLEVVLYGQSLDLVVKNKSIVPDAITNLTSKKNVAFRICAIAMQRHNLDESQLLPGVKSVPDGIYEIVKKQREGWGYIKVSH